MSIGTAGTETARAHLELLYEIGREVTSDLDLRTVLHRVLLLSMRNVGAISGSIIALDETGQPTETAFLMAGQQHSHTALQLRVTYEQGMAGWVARHQQAVLIPDTSQDERWLRRPDDAQDRTGPKSAVSVPIKSRERLVGVMTLVHPKVGFFTQEHLWLVQAIADQAGSAIQHAHLFKRLEIAHQRYRELFQDSIDPIIITDEQGRVVEANRQAESMTGLTHDQLLETPLSGFHRLDAEKVGTGFANLFSDQTVCYESVVWNRVGREIPVQVYARSIHYENSLHIQWIFRDITERKDLDALREDLIAMVYHDLRSPLSNILSSLDVLAGMIPEDKNAEVHSLLTIAARSAERIQRLTHSLLDINRLEAGQTIGSLTFTALAPLVKEVLEAIEPMIEAREISLSIDIPDDLPEILVDVDMMRRVLINLLENAMKFTPSRGKVFLYARAQDGFIQVGVKDSGPGISEADQERIFEKFTRLNTKDGTKGLGLGLAFCRLAINGHGGRIWVESQPGEGAEFKFTIPIRGEK